MYRVIVSAGNVHGISVKNVPFQTKAEATEYITIQMEKILHNSNIKHWSIEMRDCGRRA